MTAQQDNNQAVAHSRLKLIIIFTLFLGPLILALVWYYGLGAAFLQRNAVNNAPLVQPVVTLTSFDNRDTSNTEIDLDSLTGRWSVVHRIDDDCSEACQLSLYNTRQTRLALGKDANRVQRFAIGDDPGVLNGVGQDHADLQLLLNSPGGLGQQLDPITVEQTLGPDDALLIDPHGNVMMVVPVELDPSLLLKDLKKLLRLSKIG